MYLVSKLLTWRSVICSSVLLIKHLLRIAVKISVLKFNYLRFNSNCVVYDGINIVASFKIHYKMHYLLLNFYFVYLYYRDCCSLSSWFMICYIVIIFFLFTYITALMSRKWWYIFTPANTLPLPHYWSIYYNPVKYMKVVRKIKNVLPYKEIYW
jgi:hypothetical protein